MKKLAILGSGGHGKVVSDCAQLMQNWNEILFFDDRFEKERTIQALLDGDPNEFDTFVAIGNNVTREAIQTKLSNRGFSIPIIRHPSSVLAADVTAGEGSLFVAGAIANPAARIGKGCILNTASSIDHDCILGDFVHVAPGARLAGEVRVEQRTWIGLGSVVCEGKSIGSDVMVAAGAVVISDIADGKRVKGVPAR